MKNKSLVKHVIILSTIVILSVVLYTILIKIQSNLLFKSYLAYNPSGNYVVNRDFARCNFNLLDPEIARLIQFKDQNYINLFYYKPKSPFNPSKDKWANALIGSTRIYNLPFPQALQMLKKDCDQFKKNHNWSNREKEMAWIYYPKDEESYYEPIDINKTIQEEFDSLKTEKEKKEFVEQIRKEKGGEIDWEALDEIIDSLDKN